MARYLITGATGFIGQHVVHQLLSTTDHHPILLLRESYAADSPLPPPLKQHRERFDIVYADLRNYRLTTRAVQEAQADAVLHLAAAGATTPFLPIETALRHNLNGTINLLRACFEKGPPPERLVMARTPGENSHLNVYATSKLAAWSFAQMFVRTHNWPIIGAMIFQCYGPGQSEQNLIPAAIKAALQNQDFPMTAGTQAKDWIFVADVATALIRLLAAVNAPAGTTYDIGSGTPQTIRHIVEQIYTLSDSTGNPRPGLLPSRPGEVKSQAADPQPLQALTGWHPQVSLAQGLKQTIYGDIF